MELLRSQKNIITEHFDPNRIEHIKNYINIEAADDITNLLSHNNNLQELWLDQNHLQSEGVIKLAKALQDISTLTQLSVSNDNIDDEGVDDMLLLFYLAILMFKNYI